MKIRITLAAVLCAALAAPVVASNVSGFSDVADKHAHAVDYVNQRGILPPDPRATGGKYGARLRVDADEIAQAIRKIGDTEAGGYIRREEMASFMLAGIKKLRELRSPAATTTTHPPTTPTAPPRTQSRAWRGTCEELWAYTVSISYDEYGFRDDYDFTPDQWSPEREFGSPIFAGNEDIIRVTGWYKRFVTDTVFQCQGDAKLNNGLKKKYVVRAIVDADGDAFYNYVFPTGGQISCREAERSDVDWNVANYNFVFLYSQRRDADRDRLMCEDILPEDDLIRVGDAPPGGVAL